MDLLSNTRNKDLRVNPKVMIIFGPQKVGKTHALANLEGNLILDFDEEGTDYYQCDRVKVKNFETFIALRKELAEKKPMYKFITIDTLTTFYEEFINALAVHAYNTDNGKKKPLNWDINKLDYGKGHYYKREALKKQIKFFEQFCETLIISGHVADRAVNDSDSTATVKELDIEGKLKSIIASRVSAIGYMYRNASDKNENMLTFKNTGDVLAGSRAVHLSGKEFLLSKKIEDPNDSSGYKIETYWENIFK